jgi:tetratricopeptide (TPR) repeat protein
VSQKPGPFNINQAFGEALALHRQGRLAEADKVYTRVLKAAPDYFDALNLLGTVKAQLGRTGEAHRLLSNAVKINPRVPDAWANLGQVLLMLKRDSEALAAFDKACTLAPDNIAMLNHRANALLSLGRAQDALDVLRQILLRAPNHAEAHLNSGLAHAVLGLPENAIVEFDRALALAPGHPIANYNRGVALFKLGRYAEAVEANDRAVAAAPQHADAWLNRGQGLAALNRLGEAVASYGKAHGIRKDHADTYFNESLALLTLGDYRRGFELYEWRWRRTGMPAQKNRGRPVWRGDYPLTRKTILLHAEQGLGDTIQFARYVPLLAEAGAKVVLEVQPELVNVMRRLPGAAAVVARGEAPPPFDVHCPLGSLPLAFKTELGTVPADIPYLSAGEAHIAKWSSRIGAPARPRIAIVWSGNPSHFNDRNRSIPFAQMTQLFSASASFVSIQRDVRSADAEQLASETRVIHIGGELADFADTAAVIALCDLVIAVDTAVVHLAGAMGRPVWALLPFNPDWRWTLDSDRSPWYPSARLCRQPSIGDWGSVIARVGEAVAHFSGENGAGR